MNWVGAVYAGASLICASLAALGAWVALSAARSIFREHMHDAHTDFVPCLELHPEHGECIRSRAHLDTLHINSDGWTWN